MPPAKASKWVIDADTHQIDTSTDGDFHVVDKSTMMHLPKSALAKGHLHALRCHILPKSYSHKFQSAMGTWLVGATNIGSITLPKMVNFVDERESCMAVFFRVPDKGDGMPWVVCWQPPFASDSKVLVSDDSLSAVKLSQISEFYPIKNRNGGNMLSMANRVLESSAIFKHFGISTVKEAHAFADKACFEEGMQKSLSFLELAIRRDKATPRVGQKEPRAAARVEDKAAELARLNQELEHLEALKAELSKKSPVYSLPLEKRIGLASVGELADGRLQSNKFTYCRPALLSCCVATFAHSNFDPVCPQGPSSI